jgi:hypothetical protein
MKRIVALVAIGSGVGLIAGCHNDMATVSCSEVSKLSTPMGLLNTEGEVLGNLIDLDPSDKHAAYVGTLKVFNPAKDATITPDSDVEDISTSTGLSISFSVKLTEAENAALTSALSQNMQLHLVQTNRHQISQPSDVVAVPENATLIKALLKPGHHLVLVHAGNTVEKATFQLKNGANNELKVSAAGRSFDLSVNYQCQGALDNEISADKARQALTFFKIIEISANPDGSLSIGSFAGKLTDYDLGAAAIL